MGFDLRAHTMKLAQAFAKQALVDPREQNREIINAQRAAAGEAPLPAPTEYTYNPIEGINLLLGLDDPRPSSRARSYVESGPGLNPTQSAGPAGAAPAPAPAPSPEFDPSRYTADFVQGMGPEDTESLLSAVQSGNIDPRLLTALPAMWRDARSRVSGEGNRIIQALVGASSSNPEAMADPAFQRIWGTVKGNVEKAPSYREGLNAMLTAEEYSALGPGGAPAAAGPEVEAPDVAATDAAPDRKEVVEKMETPGPAVPFRSMTEALTIPPQTVPMAPLPSAGGGKAGPLAQAPALTPPGLAGPSSLERDVSDLKNQAEAARRPGLTGAREMGQWVTPMQPLPTVGPQIVRPIGAGSVGPYKVPGPPLPGRVKEQALRPILASLGLLQGAMDKTANDFAKGAFDSMMQDLAGWASAGASELEKIGMEAMLSIPEGEDRETGAKIAQADALGRIMAASHVAWMIKASGGGSELSVEEQVQGRSYNNPTGQHLLPARGYDANRGQKDDSTLELPTGNHQPGAH